MGLDTIDRARSRPGDGSMLVYPAHSWEREQLQGDHGAYIEEIRDRSSGNVTICLYWLEFSQPRIRRAYEEAGFRVISHGLKRDPGFLWRQIEEILHHDTVASNTVSTALWYGGALGREILRFGQEFTLHGPEFGREWSAYQARIWPEISDEALPIADSIAISESQLGAAHLRHPNDLRALLRPVDASDRGLPSILLSAEYQARRVAAALKARRRPDAVRDRNLQIMREAARS